MVVKLRFIWTPFVIPFPRGTDAADINTLASRGIGVWTVYLPRRILRMPVCPTHEPDAAQRHTAVSNAGTEVRYSIDLGGLAGGLQFWDIETCRTSLLGVSAVHSEKKGIGSFKMILRIRCSCPILTYVDKHPRAPKRLLWW